MSALTAANIARQEKALDRLYRMNGEVTTFRQTIERGDYASKVIDDLGYGLTLSDGSRTIRVCPKMVFEWADLPMIDNRTTGSAE